MSIDERIKDAWENGDFMPETGSKYERDSFAAGYREALRGLFVEVKPEDLDEGQIYHAAWSGQSMREVYFDGEYLCHWEQGGVGPNGEIENIERQILPENCEIREFKFPNPAEIFADPTTL